MSKVSRSVLGLPAIIRLIHALLLTGSVLFATSARAEKITIAAAADLKFAMDEIVSAFKKEHPADEIDVVYGSSGKFSTQIQKNAPYDLFFSADIGFPRELAKAGLAASKCSPTPSAASYCGVLVSTPPS